MTLLALVLVGLLSGCGPNESQAAGAVLLMAPLVHLITVGVLKGMARLWGMIRGGQPDFRPAWTACCVLLLCPVVAVLGSRGPFEYSVMALWLWGTSHLAIVLVTWRIWLQVRPGTAFTWASIPPLVVGLMPALFMLSSHRRGTGELVLYLWILPGYAGIVPGVLLVGLVAEAIVRIRRSRPPSRPG